MADQTINGVPLFPLGPNWRERYSVAYEFKTDIFTSRSGKEQRRAQRTTPRKQVKFTVTRTQSDARAFSRFMAKYQGPPVILADASRFARLVVDASAATNIIQLDTVDAPWIDGTQSLILSFAKNYLPVRVLSVNRELRTVLLSAPLGSAWPAGTKIHPPIRGTFDSSISTNNYADRTIEADVSFRADPGTVLADDAQSPLEVFNNREVFTFRPNFLRPIEGEFRRIADVVDFGRGRIQTFLPVGFSTRTKQFQMLEATQSERIALIGLFLRMKGQLGEFYMPSYEDDFTPLGSAPAGGLTATFAGTTLADVYAADGVHRAVVIIGPNGEHFYRRVTAATSDGINTTIATDTPWPCAIEPNSRLNWLLVHRFAVDLLTVDCVTDEVSQAQLSVLTLEDLPVVAPDTVFNGIDQGTEWVLDNFGLRYFLGISDQLDFIVNTEYPYITLTVGLIGVDAAADKLGSALFNYTSLTHRSH